MSLFVASLTGHVGVVRKLLAGGESDPGQLDYAGWTPLISASQNGHVGVVRELLLTGKSKPQHADKFGYTALIHASHAGHVDVVRELLASGESSPGHKDNFGWTALTHASGKIANLIKCRLVLDEVMRRRAILFKCTECWRRSIDNAKPGSNVFYYNMGQALQQPTTIEELSKDMGKIVTEENHRFYLIGVTC